VIVVRIELLMYYHWDGLLLYISNDLWSSCLCLQLQGWPTPTWRLASMAATVTTGGWTPSTSRNCWSRGWCLNCDDQELLWCLPAVPTGKINKCRCLNSEPAWCICL
jgi:hypothetical protein